MSRDVVHRCVEGTTHHHAPDLKWTLYAAGWGLLMMTVGPMIFYRLEPQFAESI